MAINITSLTNLIDDELARIVDTRVTGHIRALLIEPTPLLRDWEYGPAGQQYVCWNVLEHLPSKTAIAYCESGFGPKTPWGLVALTGPYMSMGMDSGWFTTFLQAYLEFVVATELPIWRVFKTDPSGLRLPITPEDGWDETWKQVMRYREEDTASRYDCDTTIAFQKE